MDNNNPQPSKPTISLKSSKLIISVLLIFLATALAIGGYTAQKQKNSTAKNDKTISGPYSATYSNLDSASLFQPSPGSNLTLNKPVEFTDPQVPAEFKVNPETQAPGQLKKVVRVFKEGTLVPLGGVEAAAAPSAKELTAEDLKAYASSFTDSKNSAGKDQLKPVQDFVNQRLGARFDVTFSSAKAVSATNIAGRAWQVEFTAKAKTFQQIKTTPPNLKGKAIFISGKKTFYYLMIYTVDYNWDANQQTWQKVLNSIKVDQ